MIRKWALGLVVGAMALSGLPREGSAKLVAAWLFDENSGASAKDVVSGMTGSLKGGASWGSGKFGSAFKFDGASGQVDIPDPNHVLTPKNITLTAWVNLANVSGTKSIAEQYDWAGDLGAHAFRMDGNRVQLWVIWGPSGDNAVGGAINPNEWTHVAGSWNGETVRVYVNGKMAAEKTLAKKDMVASNKSLSIGVRGDSKDVHWMSGSIDEVALFDEALSEAALANVMTGIQNSGTAVSPKDKMATAWATLKDARF